MPLRKFVGLKTFVIDDTTFALTKDTANRLEICKLEISSHASCLQTLCFLELPLLTSLAGGTSVVLKEIHMEWVPTSEDYVRSRSSRGHHLPFYSSTVSSIALLLGYEYYHPTGIFQFSYEYTMIINVKAIRSVIRSGVHNVPWEDWGPSGTHLFEKTSLKPAGPFWIRGAYRPVVRQYDLRHARYYTRPIADDMSSQTRLHNRIWDRGHIETNLPYRNVLAKNLNFDHSRDIKILAQGVDCQDSRVRSTWIFFLSYMTFILMGV